MTHDDNEALMTTSSTPKTPKKLGRAAALLALPLAGALAAVLAQAHVRSAAADPGLHSTTTHAAEPRPADGARGAAGKSPWGADDQIGTLNKMNDEQRLKVLQRIASGKVYDLSVEYFVGMPSWYALGDPRYQYHLTHTPNGTVVDDPMKVGRDMNEKVSYTGDAITMYTHMGTHIDALNHFGLHGEIWNGFRADDHVGDKGWTKGGAEVLPPIVARGVLIDIPRAKGVEELPPSYRILPEDLRQALDKQKTRIEPGDVVLVRTGRMRHFHEENARYMENPPGLGLDAARWLVEEAGVMTLGADNLSLETFPVETADNWIPVHTYLLAERGVPFMEVVNLEEIARDQVYEFAFIAASLKLRGASGAPMRPIALPIRGEEARGG
jgi:kynurenine formamidase